MKIYLDTNIYFRNTDDQLQPRINLETQAILTIFSAIEEKLFELITSDILIFEISQNTKKENSEIQGKLLKLASAHIKHSKKIINRTELYKNDFNILPADAMHIAVAEIGKVNYFITCDDILLKKVNKFQNELLFSAFNPVDFVINYPFLNFKNNPN